MSKVGFAVGRRPKICNGQEEEEEEEEEKKISSSKTRCDPVAPGKNPPKNGKYILLLRTNYVIVRVCVFLPLADSEAVRRRPRNHFLTHPPTLPTLLKSSYCRPPMPWNETSKTHGVTLGHQKVKKRHKYAIFVTNTIETLGHCVTL